jgi:hypothetical protein
MNTLTVEQEKLLPCPFCGSEAKRGMHTDWSKATWEDGLGAPGRITYHYHSIACDECGVKIQWHSLSDQSPAGLAEAWNRRSPSAELGQTKVRPPLHIEGVSDTPPPPADVPKRILSVEDITATEASFRDPPADVQAVVEGLQAVLQRECFQTASYRREANWIEEAITFLQQRPFSEELRQAEPSPGLLMSMALRYDHGLGMPGYYDEYGSPGVTHAMRLDSTLRTMRQLWEEVTGKGFYSPEKEAEYTALLTRAAEGKP